MNPATIGSNTGVIPVSYGMPEVDIYGFANLGLQYAAGGRVATSYQIADEVNWTRGGHAWRFGSFPDSILWADDGIDDDVCDVGFVLLRFLCTAGYHLFFRGPRNMSRWAFVVLTLTEAVVPETFRGVDYFV